MEDKKEVLEVIHKDGDNEIEGRVLKALELYESRKAKEATEAAELSTRIEERALEIAEEKLKERNPSKAIRAHPCL